MLFNSYEFLYAFLPTAYILFKLCSRFGIRAGVGFLGIASAFFYSYWSFSSLPILVASIAVNYLVGQRLNESGLSVRTRKRFFVMGIVFNLLLISYFKYGAFFVGNVSLLLNWVGLPVLAVPDPSLPIGISFFTFTQIAYLVDSYRQVGSKTSFDRYFVFVTYFPHLIAGPILHYRQLLPQLVSAETKSRSKEMVSLGLFVFGFGLAKKVLIADTLAPIADAGFNASRAGEVLSFAGSWIACFAYTFQIYFDFSGYSEMAVGISLLFGIFLPVNFFSPYKATSIIEFWRRWHISLSAFLRDYLYIPLGGNRLGSLRRYLNVLTTMLIGGLWHGANWTFVLWGVIHGVFLVINHFIRDRVRLSHPGRLFKAAGWASTFFGVSVAWVLFRADSVHDAWRMYRSMFDFAAIREISVGLLSWNSTWIDRFLKDDVVSGYALNQSFPLVSLALALCLLTAPIVEVRSGPMPVGSRYMDVAVKSPFFGVAAALLTAIGIYLSTLLMDKIAPFLYFQF